MKQLLYIFFFFILLTCTEKHNYITEANFHKYLNFYSNIKNGITQEQARKHYEQFCDEILLNTINKEIPFINIFDSLNRMLNLRDILIRETVILASNVHCGWGQEGLENDFPKALKKVDPLENRLDIICLLIKDSIDYKNPQTFNEALRKYMHIYKNTFIIDVIESRKLNLFTNPTWMYINERKIVEKVGFGVSSINLFTIVRLKPDSSIIHL